MPYICKRNKETNIMTTQDKIQYIQELFGIKADVMAVAMGITTNSYRKKKSAKCINRSFSDKNLQDLREYIKTNSKEI